VVKVPAPGGKLSSQMIPSTKVQETLKPIKLTNPEPGIHVYEFDHLFGGWTRLHLKGAEGTEVRIEYSSRILDKGLIDKTPRPGKEETDFYVLKGEPKGEVYEPRFTFHPVRYVQITGYPGEPALDSLEGRKVYTDEDLTGHFECSNPLFNKIHDMVELTIENALKGFLLDCMHREPLGYNEPASVSATLFTRKHMPRFWVKYVEDIRLTSQDDGAISDIAPLFPGMRREPDVAQGANYPMLVWYLYQDLGDERLLERHYPEVKGWVNCIANTLCDGVQVKKGWLGDHMLPGHAPGYEFWRSEETPPELIWDALYYRNLCIVMEMAKLLGKDADVEHYSNLADSVKKTFNETWRDKTTGHYGLPSQTSELLPLHIGLVPEAHKAQLIKNIATIITEKDNRHLRVGHAGLPALIEGMTPHGLGELMYEIVNQTTYPGWGYMIDQGSTTVWECWGRDWASKGGRRRSDNMTMLGGVNGFFYRYLAGIQGPDFYGPAIMKPAFKEFQIKPYVLGDLTHVDASIETVRGTISSSWKRTDKGLTLNVTIPGNSQAKVCVPKLGIKDPQVKESGKTVYKNKAFIKGVSGVSTGLDDGDYIIFNVGSGAYAFEISGN
jgi:alpha-L-rhamnosidase